MERVSLASPFCERTRTDTSAPRCLLNSRQVYVAYDEDDPDRCIARHNCLKQRAYQVLATIPNNYDSEWVGQLACGGFRCLPGGEWIPGALFLWD